MTPERLAEIRKVAHSFSVLQYAIAGSPQGWPWTSAASTNQVVDLVRAVPDLLAEIAGAEMERDAGLVMLAEQQEAARSIMWMAEKYAEGGGSNGPEMVDYLAAEEILNAVPAQRGRQILAEIERLHQAVRAFVEHHDGGQAGQPGHPKTYGEQDIWLAEWDRRYAAIREQIAAFKAGKGEGDRDV